MLTLFTSPGTVALASDIALREAGAEFELKMVDFAAAEQTKPAYHEINPKGRVPALITDQGVLTETPAILTWIAQTWPDAGLAPADPFAFARMQELNAYLCSTLHVNHAHGRRGSRWADHEESFEDMRAKTPRTVGDAFRHIEENALKGPWVLGDAYSTSDAYLYTVSRWLEPDKLSPADFPAIAAHRARMQERPAVQAALAGQGLKPV